MRARFAFPAFLVVVSAALLLSACSSTSETTAEAPSATEEASTAELEALYRARKDDARTRFTDDDVQFMVGMIGHHAQALIMSDLAPENGASAEVQRLAARIINAQKDEIATMQRWLRDRGQPVPEVRIDGLNLMIHMEGGGNDRHGGHAEGHMGGHGGQMAGHMDHTNMPGMLSQAQLEELAAARGREFDRLFLAYMIQHHRGAVVMVEDLFAADGAAQGTDTFKLASDIQVDQRTEIARMQRMLDALSDS